MRRKHAGYIPIRDQALRTRQSPVPPRATNGMLRLETGLMAFTVSLFAVLAISAALMYRAPNPCATTGDRLTKAAVVSRLFRIQYGFWPTNLDQMVRSGMISATDTNDGWGRPLIYAPYDFTLTRGTVSSHGSDGKPGGAGEAADRQATFW